MDEPILETLAFNLDSDLSLDEGVSKITGQCLAGPREIHEVGETSDDCDSKLSQSLNPKYCMKGVLYNSLRLTPCIFPECPFISSQPLVDERGNKCYNEYVDHLKIQHQFLILDIDSIANLHKYAINWKEMFAETSFKEICAACPESKDSLSHDRMEMDTAIAATSENTKISTMSIPPDLEEDKELRNKLWTERIEAVLEVSRYEREQTDLAIECLFCKEICTGNRTNLLSHMLENHSFHIGKADNIVFIQELMSFLAENLRKLKCIFCEKIFKDRTVLREHMRKKQHKQINPANNEYDVYYLVNYLEPGKTWQALDEENPIDERREEEWIETREENTSIVCLFCSYQTSEFNKILAHMIEIHKFDFEKLTIDKDFYEKVKIVNFIRRNMHQTVCIYCEMKFLERTSLIQHIESQHHECGSEFPPSKTWNRPEYFFPTYENDQFLILLENDNYMEEDGLLLDSTEINENVIPEEQINSLPSSFYAINNELRSLPSSCFQIQDQN